MSRKEVSYSVLNSNQLLLLESAQRDDIINLLNVTKVDLTSIQKAINDATNAEYNRALSQAKREWEVLMQKEFDNKFLVFEANKAKELLEKDQIIREKDALVKSIKGELELEYSQKNNKLQTQLEILKNEISQLTQSHQDKLQVAIGKLENEKNALINSLKTDLQIKEEKLKALEREKSTLNIKEIGEDLELWCKRQYDQLTLSGFANTQFEKTSKDINGTKPDYLFTAFASDTNKPLVKVVCEMKSEALVDGNKKKNSDHYDKLNSDRIKHGGEDSYALLVSELEKDNSNIIERVVGYDKMYMVRPAYFIPFLSLVYNLSLKFEDVVLESIKFESKEKILNDFENMKKDIIDVTFGKLTKHAESMVSKVGKIKDLCVEIENDHIEQILKNMNTIKNKIEGFSIYRIIKEIEKIEIV